MTLLRWEIPRHSDTSLEAKTEFGTYVVYPNAGWAHDIWVAYMDKLDSAQEGFAYVLEKLGQHPFCATAQAVCENHYLKLLKESQND